MSANTNVSTPAAGVNPGAAFAARNNSGSNIGVPYTRLCPVNNEQPLGKRSNDGSTKNMQTETQSLRATTLAFILGKRSKFPALRADPASGDRSQLHMMHTLMPGMPGTERFQALCSLEYLQLYYKHVLSKHQIKLNETIQNVLARPDHAYPCPNGKVQLADTDVLANVSDIARQGNTTMAASEMGQSPDRYQGIFARDVGPFLRGKGVDQSMLQTTTARVLVKDSGKEWTPCLRSRNAGDELAFAALNQQLSDLGMHDWQPDGIVLSKGADDPSDKESDAFLNARDGQLYNVRVQGPAITTTWTGDSSMETLPMDRVFCVIIADVWFDASGDAKTAIDNFNTGKAPRTTEGEKQLSPSEAYEAFKKTKMEKSQLVDTPAKEDEFLKKGLDAFKGKSENTVLTNFRIELSTSSQMINYSHLRHSTTARTVNGKRSRMGLKLAEDVGEYIVGGWTIGNVMDTSASRGSFPTGSTVGVRTAPNTAALNVNVQIGYWDADRMWRTFMNKEGTTTPRYQAFKGGPTQAINQTGEKKAVDSKKKA